MRLPFCVCFCVVLPTRRLIFSWASRPPFAESSCAQFFACGVQFHDDSSSTNMASIAKEVSRDAFTVHAVPAAALRDAVENDEAEKFFGSLGLDVASLRALAASRGVTACLWCRSIFPVRDIFPGHMHCPMRDAELRRDGKLRGEQVAIAHPDWFLLSNTKQALANFMEAIAAVLGSDQPVELRCAAPECDQRLFHAHATQRQKFDFTRHVFQHVASAGSGPNGRFFSDVVLESIPASPRPVQAPGAVAAAGVEVVVVEAPTLAQVSVSVSDLRTALDIAANAECTDVERGFLARMAVARTLAVSRPLFNGAVGAVGDALRLHPSLVNLSPFLSAALSLSPEWVPLPGPWTGVAGHMLQGAIALCNGILASHTARSTARGITSAKAPRGSRDSEDEAEDRAPQRQKLEARAVDDRVPLMEVGVVVEYHGVEGRFVTVPWSDEALKLSTASPELLKWRRFALTIQQAILLSKLTTIPAHTLSQYPQVVEDLHHLCSNAFDRGEGMPQLSIALGELPLFHELMGATGESVRRSPPATMAIFSFLANLADFCERAFPASGWYAGIMELAGAVRNREFRDKDTDTSYDVIEFWDCYTSVRTIAHRRALEQATYGISRSERTAMQRAVERANILGTASLYNDIREAYWHAKATGSLASNRPAYIPGAHPRAAGNQQPKLTRPAPKTLGDACRMFRDTGTCRFGDRCRFAHVARSAGTTPGDDGAVAPTTVTAAAAAAAAAPLLLLADAARTGAAPATARVAPAGGAWRPRPAVTAPSAATAAKST